MKNLFSLTKILLITTALGIVGLLVTLAFYNCPSVADDFCFSATAKNFGFWTAQKMYYNGWSGRYLSNFIFHINPLVFTQNRVAFVVFPILFLLIFLLNSYMFFQTIFKNIMEKQMVFFLTIGFFLLYYSNIESIYENIYWFSGSYTFVSANLMMLLLQILVRYWRGEEKNIYWFISKFGGLLFLLLGSSEVTMLAVSLIIFLIIVYGYFENKKHFQLFSPMILIVLFGNFLVITAPGNKIRQSQNPELIDVILKTWNTSLHFFIEWAFLSPLLIIATIAFVLLVKDLPKQKIFNVPIWLVFGLFVCLFGVFFFPTAWGLGLTQPPPRVLNMIYLYFIIGWFYMVCVILNRVHLPSFQTNWVSIVLLCMFFVVEMYKCTNLRKMYGDIRMGAAANYLKEYKKRVEIIENTKEDVVYLEPFKHKPHCLYAEDLHDNPSHLWNKCIGLYFNKKQIKIKTLE